MKLIPLTRGHFAMVDDEDFEQVSQFKWHLKSGCGGVTKYAVHEVRTQTARVTVFLHDFITGLGKHAVDHKDGNGLNNQKYNFRRATFSDNLKNKGIQARNKSGFKGVSKHPHGGWRADISVEGKSVYLGFSKDPKTLAAIYDIAAAKHYGEFARTNKMMGLL